jgi:hypothetical protein
MTKPANNNGEEPHIKADDWREALKIGMAAKGGSTIRSADGWDFTFGSAMIYPARLSPKPPR